MKKRFLSTSLLYVVSSVIMFSCKKEIPPDNTAGINNPPIANAGSDQVINLPADSVLLDGNASKDPDGLISSYYWTKISGPSSFFIANKNGEKTIAYNLVKGTYEFELKVTDIGGLYSKDTVMIFVIQTDKDSFCSTNRLQQKAQLLAFETLSQSRFGIGAASAGDKLFFAGGYTDWNLTTSSRVDIYDINTQSWSTAELSVARSRIISVAVDNKIFFAGGERENPLDNDNPLMVNVMDIYDVSTNSWSVISLPKGRSYFSSTSVNNKVFFADEQEIDIYDLITQSWSTKILSEKRSGFTMVSSGNKVYFAGGKIMQGSNIYGPILIPSDKIDIYDDSTKTWSVSNLSEGKIFSAGIVIADKLYFAGGYNSNTNSPPFTTTCTMDIIDAITGIKSVQYLSRKWPNPGRIAAKGNKIVFLTGDLNYRSNTEFDIYDVVNNIWSIGVLPLDQNRFTMSTSIISDGNSIYLAGGHVANGVISNQVYKLEF